MARLGMKKSEGKVIRREGVGRGSDLEDWEWGRWGALSRSPHSTPIPATTEQVTILSPRTLDSRPSLDNLGIPTRLHLLRVAELNTKCRDTRAIIVPSV
jgi:hypothetical protein